jgi:hypothetical protein
MEETSSSTADAGITAAASAQLDEGSPEVELKLDAFTMIPRTTIEQSLLPASLEEDLKEISHQFSQPCYSERFRKHETYAQALLRSLPPVKRLDDQGDKLNLETTLGLTKLLRRLLQTLVISADFAEKTSIKTILGQVRQSKWGLSDIAVLTADTLYQRFEAQKWGQKDKPAVKAGSSQQKKRKRETSPGAEKA